MHDIIVPQGLRESYLRQHAPIYKKQHLNEHSKRVNEVAIELCKRDPALVFNRGSLKVLHCFFPAPWLI